MHDTDAQNTFYVTSLTLGCLTSVSYDFGFSTKHNYRGISHLRRARARVCVCVCFHTWHSNDHIERNRVVRA